MDVIIYLLFQKGIENTDNLLNVRIALKAIRKHFYYYGCCHPCYHNCIIIFTFLQVSFGKTITRLKVINPFLKAKLFNISGLSVSNG